MRKREGQSEHTFSPSPRGLLHTSSDRETRDMCECPRQNAPQREKTETQSATG
ncbi:unnamed protein product [Ectocarpus sp. 4 AP-2014]